MAYNYLEELYFQTLWNHSVEDAAKKSAETTTQIAIEFAEWLDYTNEQVKENSNYESWFEEFLKSKQPNDGIQTD
jgi:hypothetical protein